MVCHPWSVRHSVQYVSIESGGLGLWSCQPVKWKPLYNHPIMQAFNRTSLDTPEDGAEWAAEKPGHWTADDRCAIGRRAGKKKQIISSEPFQRTGGTNTSINRIFCYSKRRMFALLLKRNEQVTEVLSRWRRWFKRKHFRESVPNTSSAIRTFPAFYRIRMFITVFIRVRYLALAWAVRIRPTTSNPISLRTILIFNIVFTVHLV
jgi:hypothetical protein